jgi:hypothetical protein
VESRLFRALLPYRVANELSVRSGLGDIRRGPNPRPERRVRRRRYSRGPRHSRIGRECRLRSMPTEGWPQPIGLGVISNDFIFIHLSNTACESRMRKLQIDHQTACFDWLSSRANLLPGSMITICSNEDGYVVIARVPRFYGINCLIWGSVPRSLRAAPGAMPKG